MGFLRLSKSIFRRPSIGIIAVQVVIIFFFVAAYQSRFSLLQIQTGNNLRYSLIPWNFNTTPSPYRITYETAFQAKPVVLRELPLTEAGPQPYFQPLSNAPGETKACFVPGTDRDKTWTSSNKSSQCICAANYFGEDCGIPACVWHGCIERNCAPMNLSRRTVPRRLIHAFNVHHEFDMFQARLVELDDVVDVYLICESNYTAGGDPKPIHFLDRFASGEGFMAEYHSKIVYVFLDHFPPQGKTDGWYADTYLRNYMGSEGLKRIKGLKDDDLFVLLDADEIPRKELLLFLKLYDGYPEPVRFAMRWSVYGFFWKKLPDSAQQTEELTEVVAVATIGMVRQVYDNQVMAIRRHRLGDANYIPKVHAYVEKGHPVQLWTAGARGHYAGFHCSWCYNPEGIRDKLVSAQRADTPRWGDYPEKLKLDYLQRLIDNGEWFDGTIPFRRTSMEQEGERNYAPEYIRKHPEQYGSILFPMQRESV